MSALLALAGLALQAVLLLVIVAVVGFTAWVVWDCMAGPSSRIAAAARREGVPRA